jgi:muramoyltetrapeptide carboxypeptidase LdcA involved in peptidoglycan recycling
MQSDVSATYYAWMFGDIYSLSGSSDVYKTLFIIHSKPLKITACYNYMSCHIPDKLKTPVNVAAKINTNYRKTRILNSAVI